MVQCGVCREAHIAGVVRKANAGILGIASLPNTPLAEEAFLPCCHLQVNAVSPHVALLDEARGLCAAITAVS